MVGTPADAFASAGFAHPTRQFVGWAKARLRRAHQSSFPDALRWNGGHTCGRVRVRRLCPPYASVRRVGKGALAPCPPIIMSGCAEMEWWAHLRTRSRPQALPTLRARLESQC